MKNVGMVSEHFCVAVLFKVFKNFFGKNIFINYKDISHTENGTQTPKSHHCCKEIKVMSKILTSSSTAQVLMTHFSINQKQHFQTILTFLYDLSICNVFVFYATSVYFAIDAISS